MTGSQVKNWIGSVLTTVSTICAAVLPILQPLPPPFNRYAFYVSLVGAVAGSQLSTWNQSASTNHVSVPKANLEILEPETLSALGVSKQVEGKG
jgi:hypothetical protein